MTKNVRTTAGSAARAVTAGPRKVAMPALIADLHPARAFALIAHACAQQLAANAPGARAGQDPEYVHQMRVALRRLRSALRLFRAYLPQDFVHRIGPELQWLASLLGRARDLDVLAAETLPRVMRTGRQSRAGAAERQISATIHAPRVAAARAVTRALRSRRYTALLGDLGETTLLLRTSDTVGVGGKDDLRDYAARKLGRAQSRLDLKPRELAALDAEQRHAFRIAAKRLRYSVEFFAPLFAHRRAQAYALRLAQLQEALGMLNDGAVALSLLAALPLPPRVHAQAQERLLRQQQEWMGKARAAHRQLRRARPFW